MYYDDEARRFNFLSGLLFGAVLGAGLALLASPQERARGRLPGRGARRRLPRQVGRKLHRVRDDLVDSVSEAIASGRRILG